jgi:hypothetical protein
MGMPVANVWKAPPNSQGGYESSDLENGNHCANLCSCGLVEVALEVGAGNDTTHDTLIVAEQEDT